MKSKAQLANAITNRPWLFALASLSFVSTCLLLGLWLYDPAKYQRAEPALGILALLTFLLGIPSIREFFITDRDQQDVGHLPPSPSETSSQQATTPSDMMQPPLSGKQPHASNQVMTSYISTSFETIDCMKVGRAHHVSALLTNGNVLIAGGFSRDDDSPQEVLKSAWIYDPVNKTVHPTGQMTARRYFAAATVLSNNTVLITGGVGEDGETLGTAELYNPDAGTFTSAGRMITARHGHVMILLQSGKVLIVGGLGSGNTRLALAEIYDPNKGIFEAIAPMVTARGTEHTPNAVLLGNGKVLIAGGYGDSGQLESSELYDPEKNVFIATGDMTTKRACHSLTLLPDGKVLVAGGHEDVGGHLKSAEVYDVERGGFTLTQNMHVTHFLHTATLLPNGKVFLAGGFSPLTELYDPKLNAFSPCCELNRDRTLHTAAVLADKRVLVIGGASNGYTLKSMEISPTFT